jgi:hypothetical protein
MKKSSYLPFKGIALIADPIYNYIPFTVAHNTAPLEATERDLIDSPWMQRLRRIHQLQSARWVYPSAEHTRFQHSLGTMHMAGEFARHLYQSLCAVCPGVPSCNFIEELLRIAGLLHDIGHGPYGHFFDEHFLSRYRLTHEILGQEIIRRELGDIIKNIRRSPHGPFESKERINPEDVAFLIKKPQEGERTDVRKPRWLTFLQQLFSGIYTVDNLDYVQRDAYMTGFSLDMVDMRRLLFYSFFSDQGLTLHQAGVSALTRFLNARLSLYSNVYYHRTTRAIDFHMQEIFQQTMKIIFPVNPLRALNRYLSLNDWFLLQEVEQWKRKGQGGKKYLGREWAQIIERRIKWKMAYATELTIDQAMRGMIAFTRPEQFEQAIRERLPQHIRTIDFRIDIAMQDPRPLNPMAEGNKRINIYNASTGVTSPEPLKEIFKYIPARIVHFRVFTLNHAHDSELAAAAEQIFNPPSSVSFDTNV